MTPFYNTGVVFHETARSVLGQSFQQWEWLIVNDGSLEHLRAQVEQMFRPELRAMSPGPRGEVAAALDEFHEADRSTTL